MKMTERFKAREKYKLAQYQLADERDSAAGLSQVCVLCRLGVPGGSHRASAHHEILSKAELPGRKNWATLFSPANIAPACSVHHEKLGHLRLLWLKSMVVVGLARAEQYRLEPFSAYWQAAPYPPCGECVGHFGYGDEYFRSVDRLPDSLARLYKLANREFGESRFCDTCPQAVRCRLLTAGETSERFSETTPKPRTRTSSHVPQYAEEAACSGRTDT
jgi:hypothetical protein